MKSISIVSPRFVFAAAAAALAFAFVGVSLAHADVAYTRSLDQGQSGSDVTQLQTMLAMDTSIYPQGLITGYFGGLTAAAVTRFQIAHGLPGVGRVGPLTLQLLNSMLGNTTGDANAPTIFSISTPVGSNNATVNWSTNETSNGIVYYSTSPMTVFEASADRQAPQISGANVMSTTAAGLSQSVTIPNLSSGTTYYYTIMATDASGNVSISLPNYSFRTN